MNELHILSLGAGVQSSTLALMAAAGEITPMPVAAVFADTQAEPPSVYKWLDWLEKQLPFPVHRVTKGNLETESLRLRTSATGKIYTKAAPPAFIVSPDGKTGLLMRQCTEDYKINEIKRAIRKLMLKHKAGLVTQWIGISTDEMRRMKQAKVQYLKNRWPLIELGMSREDCLRWMKEQKFPEPPRSSCVFCPYHNDKEWLRLKESEPDQFQRAVAYERQLQEAYKHVVNFRGTPYLHRSLTPLDKIEFNKADSQMSLFQNDCIGICGV